MDGPLSFTPVIGTLLAVIPFFFVARIFYRLYLHPLSKYPGPRLAAISSLYRAYHQTWRDGRLVEQLTHLHEIYGKPPPFHCRYIIHHSSNFFSL